MQKGGLSREQLLLLARSWDLRGEPQLTEQGMVFEAFGGRRLLRAAPMAETAFVYYLQKYLYGRGFARVQRFIPDKYGDAYAIWGDYGVYLTDYHAGACSMKSEYFLWQTAALLADFHNAAAGLSIPGAPLERVASPLEYALWLTEQPAPPMNMYVLPLYERLCEAAREALARAAEAPLQGLCAAAREQGSVIHGRFDENCLCEYYGELLIKELGSASYGLPVWDLAYLLGRGLALTDGYDGVLNGALREYEKRRPLSGGEKQLLRALLGVPLDFVFALGDWREQKLGGEAFAETVLREENMLPLRRQIRLE